MAKDFLVEIGTEELPPKSLKTLSEAFTTGIKQQLENAGLGFQEARGFATPRRLAVLVKDLDEQTPRKEQTIWGPPAKIAFDAEGKPTKAAQAFARKNGIDVNELKTESDGKVEKLIYRCNTGGLATVVLLEQAVSASLATLPIPKRMRWGTRRDEFVRPIHWVLMLFGDEIVSASILGLLASRETRGHRFHYNQPLIIDTPAEYVEKLLSPGFVIADFNERREKIRHQVENCAKKAGGRAVIDPDLLDEVTGLVEWPVALTGKFEQRFLKVPAEALISSMKEHQKYFHVVDIENKLLPCFITVANIESLDPVQVIDGNERVIRPRLADAAFFFETDKKVPLQQRRMQLKSVVFQAKLGSLYDKTERVAQLARSIAGNLGADEKKACRAAELSKADLVTDMVGEFADMQGIAGYYYACNDREDPEVAQALNEQYLPRFSGDSLPATTVGTILAIADRLDTLVGIFGIDQLPTGSKDPFALRRASLGVLRLLVENNLDLDLRDLLQVSQNQYPILSGKADVVDNVLSYMFERFRAWYEDKDIPTPVFLAVSAKQISKPLDFNNRVLAVHRFSQLPQAQALAAANKRVSNILSKQQTPHKATLDMNLLKEVAEINLAGEIASKSKQVSPLFAADKYTEGLEILAELRESVDAFFDSVMVMTEDATQRNNRLALLSQLRNLFLEVADISLLVPAKN